MSKVAGAVPPKTAFEDTDFTGSDVKQVVEAKKQNDTSNDTFKSTAKEFTEDVDILGLKFLCRENTHVIRKLIYLILVLFGSGFAVYQIIDQVTLYLSYPVSIRINISYVESLPFPAVTICNYNRYRRCKVPTATQNSTNFTEILMSIKEPDASPWNNRSLTEEYYQDLAHQKEETIVECKWEGTKCDHTDFTMTVADMGICYTFNSGAVPLTTSNEGETHGLRVILNTQIDEYLRTNVQAGFKVLTEESDDPALVARKGVAIPIGFQTNLGVTVMMMQNLKSPWENCTNKALPRFASYSRPACHQECVTDFVISYCNCQDMYMNDTTIRYCSPRELATCALPSHLRYSQEKKRNCSCPDPCEDKIFQTSISQATLSPDFYVNMAENHNKTEDYWRSNAAILEVYFPDLIEENVVHQASFSLMTLFCNIGGVFGLVLGAGLISVIEIFDFCITKTANGCK